MDVRLSDGITDRLQFEFDEIPDRRSRVVLRHVHVEASGIRSHEIVGLLEEAPGTAELPLQYACQGRPLRRVGAIVKVADGAAASLVDRRGPVREQRGAQAVEANVIDVPLLDDPDPAAFAVAAARPRVEVAGAAPIAIAGDEDVTIQLPCRHGTSVADRPA